MLAFTTLSLLLPALALAAPAIITPYDLPMDPKRPIDGDLIAQLQLANNLIGAQPAFLSESVTETGSLQLTTKRTNALRVHFIPVNTPGAPLGSLPTLYEMAVRMGRRDTYIVVTDTYKLMFGSSAPAHSTPTIDSTKTHEIRAESAIWHINPQTNLLQATYTGDNGDVELGLCMSLKRGLMGADHLAMVPLKANGEHDCADGFYGLSISPIHYGA